MEQQLEVLERPGL